MCTADFIPVIKTFIPEILGTNKETCDDIQYSHLYSLVEVIKCLQWNALLKVKQLETNIFQGQRHQTSFSVSLFHSNLAVPLPQARTEDRDWLTMCNCQPDSSFTNTDCKHG